MTIRLRAIALSAISICLVIHPASADSIQYPETRKADHVDTYHGMKVPDPYRWLENESSPDVATWVEAQNKVTFGYLDRIPFRAKIRARLQELYNFPKYGMPFRRGDLYFFTKNDGLQNQPVMYVQKTLQGQPEVFLDPNKLSADGTTRLGAFSVSSDGRYAAYTLSKGGSDWQEAFVMEVQTRRTLPDHIRWIKVSGLSWAGAGFYYSRYDAPAAGKELSSKNENHKVYFHKLGDAQADDQLVYEDSANPQRFHIASTTEDERFLILNVSERGAGKDGNALFVRDLTAPSKTFTPVVKEITDSQYHVVNNAGRKLLIATNQNAPNMRITLYDPDSTSSPWKEVVPEKPEPIQDADTSGGKLFVTYTKDVTSRVYVYDLAGKLENEIAMPAPGTATGFRGRNDDKETFYTFTSLETPPTIFRYDIASRKSMTFRSPDIPGFNPQRYESKQVFYNSKDGTRVPMFLVYKKGLRMNGSNPTLLYGYGGFNITVSPAFDALRLALLEQGFVYASANIRGGGEYGEKWHKSGMKLNKQNVFDDFISAAEWLISNKYTSPAKLALMGGSNGGLLVGAVMNQRPELFRAALPAVGVMDMLRFHKFTIGWNWIADYGSSEDPQEFKALYAYSPLHNVRPGAKYPAMLITTADHDDRVVPAHSFKYVATVQDKVSRDRPALIRIETKSGHGASSTTKRLDLTADQFAFLMHELGVVPQ
jgi:prolyl oligopeptidase